MEGREDEERLLSILQARLLELKGQCKEKTRAALWQHAALHAMVAGLSQQHAGVRGGPSTLRYCVEEDTVGCGLDIFVHGWRATAAWASKFEFLARNDRTLLNLYGLQPPSCGLLKLSLSHTTRTVARAHGHNCHDKGHTHER